MKRNVPANPFYDWFWHNFKSLKLGRLVISLFLALFGQIALISGFLDGLIKNYSSDDFSITNIVLQISTLTIALILYLPQLLHFDSEKFISALLSKYQNKNRGSQYKVTKEIVELAISKHVKFTQNIVVLILLLVLSYIVVIFTKYTNTDYLNTHKGLCSLLVILNSCAIWVLAANYYLLTYFKGYETFVKTRSIILIFALGILTIAAIAFAVRQDSFEELSKYCSYIYGIGGVIVGIAFTLFVSRLSDALIGTPTTVLAVLMGYSLIQGYFYLFANVFEDALLLNIVLIVSFILKCITLLYFYWLIRYDRIIVYSICHPMLYETSVDWRDVLVETIEEIEQDTNTRESRKNKID